MAEEKPSLHIDLDWKKQAQEEKRRLEEEEKRRADEAAKRAAEAVKPAAIAAPEGVDEAIAGMTPATAPAARGARGQREIPEASLQTLVNTLVTQAMLYMGEMPTSSGQTVMSLDMSKHQIDTLGVLEEKTRGNLTAEEQQALDLALYEVRTRFIGVAQQIIAGAA